MKKSKTKSLFLLFGAVALSIITSAYMEGPAAHGDYDCTGAETSTGNGFGCGIGGGCHSSRATAGITVKLELDSAGKATTHYVGGKSYTVKITGTNTTSNNLPKFGMQIAAIKGTVPITSPTMAGTWVASFPTSTQYTKPNTQYFNVGVVEHIARLSPSSGTGGSGTVYTETFNWTAPAKGTGTISFWSALNAVNNDGNNTGDYWDTTHIFITEYIPVTTDIASIEQSNPLSVTIAPNPATNNVTLEYILEENTNLQVDIYDITGRKVWAQLNEQQSAGAYSQVLDLNSLSIRRGLYFVVITNGTEVSSKKLIVD